MSDVAPWPDFKGNSIRCGDVLRHPGDGNEFVALRLPGYADEFSSWWAVYGGGKDARPVVLHLSTQIGDKGQAAVVSPSLPQQPNDNDLVKAFSDAVLASTRTTEAMRKLFEQRRNALINESIVDDIRKAAGLEGKPGDMVEVVAQLYATAQKVDNTPLTIHEEVPGCEPHWFVGGIVKGSESPKFDTHAGAVKFCEALGRTYTTEYFES